MSRWLPFLLLLPCVASAHPGHSTGTLAHFLSEPDHVAGIVLLVVLVVGAGIMIHRSRKDRDHDSR